MLEASTRSRLPVTAVVTLAIAVFAGSVVAGSALAEDGHQGESSETSVTLKGDWSAFNRCPVDDPTMLAVDGQKSVAFCLAVASPNGALTIGGLTVPTKASNTQFGLILNEENETFKIVPPAAGAVLDESIEIPNGLQALICPSQGHLARRVCRKHHDGRGDGDNEDGQELNNLTVSMESAGSPSNFNLGAGLGVNQPLISLPVKIHLENRLLGRHCYIGSDSEPIVVQPENTTAPTAAFETFDGNGTPDPSGPMILIKILATQGAGSFAVPVATGCGHRGGFDEAIDTNLGLPSAAGKNTLVLNEVTTSLTGFSSPESAAPNAGKEISKNWHSAIVPETQEEEGQEEQEEDRRHRHEHGH